MDRPFYFYGRSAEKPLAAKTCFLTTGELIPQRLSATNAPFATKASRKNPPWRAIYEPTQTRSRTYVNTAPKPLANPALWISTSNATSNTMTSPPRFSRCPWATRVACAGNPSRKSRIISSMKRCITRIAHRNATFAGKFLRRSLTIIVTKKCICGREKYPSQIHHRNKIPSCFINMLNMCNFQSKVKLSGCVNYSLNLFLLQQKIVHFLCAHTGVSS